MAKVVYVNASTGSDSNSGLTAVLAKASMAGASGARSVTAAGDRVSIAAGTYLEPDASFTSVNDNNVVYMADGSGPVIVDFANRATAGQHWLTDKLVTFISIRFRNPGATTACVASFSLATVSTLINCIFQQKDGSANTGYGAIRSTVENCSFYNLSIGYAPGGAAGQAYNNYFKSVTTPFNATCTRDYNALPSNTEPNGIDSTTTDPGFVNVSTQDFRLDPNTTPSAYTAYMAGGRWGGRIGATGTTGPYYDSRYPQTKMISPTPTPAAWPLWENDPSYTSTGTLGAVIQDPTTSELILDLNTTPAATDGRIRSEVFAAGSGLGYTIGTSSIGRFVDPPAGSMIDTDINLPAKWEYRASGLSFLKGDSLPAWSLVQASDYVNISKKYVQFRVTIRRNHTNL